MSNLANHEKLHLISDGVGEALANHVDTGGHYYDGISAHIAARAIHGIMPELMQLRKSRIVIEAGAGVALDIAGRSETLEGLRVEAQFERVSIQGLLATMGSGESALSMMSYDLCAILKPEYVDPEPLEIVFGEEIYVPFGSINLFNTSP